MKRVLGLDIGGVITDNRSQEFQVALDSPEGHLRVPAIEGAIIGALHAHAYFSRVLIISKVGEETERRTRAWLTYHDFYRQAAISEGDVFYTRTRAAKNEIAQREGVTDFVDDNLEVLMYMKGRVPHRYLFRPRADDVLAHPDVAGEVIHVASWQELMDLIRKKTP